MQIGLREGDRAARAGACVDAFLDIHAKILFAFVFFRGHEFDAHILGTAWDRLLKLKIAGF